MSWESGTATSYTDLLNRLDTFLRKGHALPVSYSNPWIGAGGTGVLSAVMGTATSVQETITVTWTSSTAFTVSGSVTGSMGSGTVGTPFSHARVSFNTVAGGTPWQAGDTASFVMTPPWTALRSVAGSEFIWRAPGDSGTEQIFVGAQAFSNVSGDYYNWRLLGATGFQSGNAFNAQPGAVTDPVLPLWNSSTPYWFVASGKRVVVVAKVSTVYEMAYLGAIDAYASPGQFSYPVAVGGSMAWYTEPAANSVNWRWSYTGNEHRGCAFGGNYSAARDVDSPIRLRKPDGTWRGFSYNSGTPVGAIWPYGNGSGTSIMTDVRPNLDGSYPLLPIVLAEDMGATENVFGELAGVMATTGHGNAAENTITVGRDTWLVVQNIHRTTKTDYCAVRLA